MGTLERVCTVLLYGLQPDDPVSVLLDVVRVEVLDVCLGVRQPPPDQVHVAPQGRRLVDARDHRQELGQAHDALAQWESTVIISLPENLSSDPKYSSFPENASSVLWCPCKLGDSQAKSDP